MDLATSITETNLAARKVYGADAWIGVARSVAFGNDDNLIIVQGARQTEIAADLCRTIQGATITTDSTEFMGKVTNSTHIAWRN